MPLIPSLDLLLLPEAPVAAADPAAGATTAGVSTLQAVLFSDAGPQAFLVPLPRRLEQAYRAWLRRLINSPATPPANSGSPTGSSGLSPSPRAGSGSKAGSGNTAGSGSTAGSLNTAGSWSEAGSWGAAVAAAALQAGQSPVPRTILERYALQLQSELQSWFRDPAWQPLQLALQQRPQLPLRLRLQGVPTWVERLPWEEIAADPTASALASTPASAVLPTPPAAAAPPGATLPQSTAPQGAAPQAGPAAPTPAAPGLQPTTWPALPGQPWWPGPVGQQQALQRQALQRQEESLSRSGRRPGRGSGRRPVWLLAPGPATGPPPCRRPPRQPRLLLLVGEEAGLALDAEIAPLQALQRRGRIALTILRRPGGNDPTTSSDLTASRDRGGDSSLASLQQALEDPRGWDAFVYLGHSQADAAGGGRLQLGDGSVLTGDLLQSTLADAARRGLQLVLFSSCSGLDLARSAIAAGVGWAVCFREPVPCAAASLAFTAVLQALEQGVDLPTALDQARDALQRHGPPTSQLLPALVGNAQVPPLQLPLRRHRQLALRLRRSQSPQAIATALLLAVASLSALAPWNPVSTYLLDRRLWLQHGWRIATDQPGWPLAPRRQQQRHGENLAPASAGPQNPAGPTSLRPADPRGTEPSAPKPLVSKPLVSKPSAPELLASEPSASQSLASQPLSFAPLAPKSLASKPLALAPTAPEPLISKLAASKPLAAKPLASEPLAPESLAVLLIDPQRSEAEFGMAPTPGRLPRAALAEILRRLSPQQVPQVALDVVLDQADATDPLLAAVLQRQQRPRVITGCFGAEAAAPASGRRSCELPPALRHSGLQPHLLDVNTPGRTGASQAQPLPLRLQAPLHQDHFAAAISGHPQPQLPADAVIDWSLPWSDLIRRIEPAALPSLRAPWLLVGSTGQVDPAHPDLFVAPGAAAEALADLSGGSRREVPGALVQAALALTLRHQLALHPLPLVPLTALAAGLGVLLAAALPHRRSRLLALLLLSGGAIPLGLQLAVSVRVLLPLLLPLTALAATTLTRRD